MKILKHFNSLGWCHTDSFITATLLLLPCCLQPYNRLHIYLHKGMMVIKPNLIPGCEVSSIKPRRTDRGALSVCVEKCHTRVPWRRPSSPPPPTPVSRAASPLSPPSPTRLSLPEQDGCLTDHPRPRPGRVPARRSGPPLINAQAGLRRGGAAWQHKTNNATAQPSLLLTEMQPGALFRPLRLHSAPCSRPSKKQPRLRLPPAPATASTKLSRPFFFFFFAVAGGRA